MYTFRWNLDTNQVEVLKNGFVEYEIHSADFKLFASTAWTVAKYPSAMRKVRNLIKYAFKQA